MNNDAKSVKYVLTALVILTLGTFLPTLAYAAPAAYSEKDWQFTDGNSWAQNYSPQTQINQNNVNNLEVKWVFPLEGKISAGASMAWLQNVAGGDGSSTPPIVRAGNVYVTTNYLRTYSVNANTGKMNWRYDYTVNLTDVQNRLPVKIGTPPHLHGFRYWEAGNALLLNGLACGIYGIDATSGKEQFRIEDLCKDVPGNLYKYYTNAGYSAVTSQANIGAYDKGRQFIVVLPGGMHSTIYAGDARHVTMGVSMDTKQILWRVFSFPPQNIPTKDWATQECASGFFGVIPCTDVQTKTPQNLEWDWAQPNEKPNIYGGVTANWGQSVVDEDTGILYTQTGNQGPYTYVGSTPGPRLYGSAIMAIDMNAGKRIWWNQPMPRDMYDYDCNWSGILADVPTLGKVYMKGCKEGRLFVLDAKTGKSFYMVDVISEQVQWGQISAAALKEPYQGGVRYHFNDPFSTYDMREIKSPDNSNYCGRPCPVYPAWSNGIFGTDMSYDPTTNTLYHYAVALQTSILESPAPVLGQSVSRTLAIPIQNTTIVARDATTGKVKWTWFQAAFQQRSTMVISSDLLFTGFTDGYLRFFNKNTGTLLREMNLGSELKVGITTGQDTKGNQLIFTMLGVGTGQTAIRPTTAGILVAVGLSDRPASTTTTTTTATTTATTTSVSTTTATTTSVSTATTSITNTVTQPAVTSTTTETVGLPAEVTYGAVGVALVAIVAAAVMMTRKRA